MIMAILDRIERGRRLDPVADRLQGMVWATVRSRRLEDLLHGTWLGHPLHPALVELPIGAWISATVLDLLPDQRGAATTLVGVGLAGAVPTAAAGWVDWASASRDQRRVGLVHAAANAGAVLLYAGSFTARLLGRHRLGRRLGWLGMLTVGTGAYLGGHLSYRLATGVSHSQTEQHALPEGWQDLGKVADFPDGARVCRLIGDVPVLVIRHGDRVTVLLDRCAHLGGPLHSGEPALVDGQDCVVCPWHGSIYRVADGAVLRGPATAPQSRLDVRLENGRVRARRPG
jgi:nitrite reductase/ring-hydroxylating ferredoxin subunit/uncharacterized membrane protein